MSVDMNTHGRDIRKAIDAVVSDSGNDWCIFGYEGKTYTLKVVGEGDGGLDEMADEFHGSKIMYGYARVKEPNTGLPKFVFINWQGEGAPERMKFACSSHSAEVQRICRTVHVTVNARDESDVDSNDIVNRVVKASGSQYSVLKSSDTPAPVEPVQEIEDPGSVYKRTSATSEILNRERDNYWMHIENEERKAKAEEERRKKEEKNRLERERRELDLREAEERARRTAERSQQIAMQRQRERQVQLRQTSQEQSHDNIDDVAMQEKERRQRSESLKNERQSELASLIAQRNASGMAPSQKVGTSYKRVDPRSEISASRDNYWRKMEEQEAAEKDEERRRRASEAAALERERLRREEEDSKRREAAERDRASVIARQRQAERRQSMEEQRQKEASERAIHQEAIADEEERRSRSERLRKERQEEAARLIQGGGSAAATARSYFQRRTSGTGFEEPPPSRPQPIKIHTAPAPAPAPAPAFAPAPVRNSAPAPAPAPVPVYQPPPPVPHDDEGGSGWTDDEEEQQQQHQPQPAYEPEPQPAYEPEPEPAVVWQGASDAANAQGDRGLCAEAVYDYQATEDDEISFNPGEIICRIEMIDDGWWTGEAPDGHHGLFPANYVRLLQ